MKYKLERPNLNITELSKLNFYASYVGYNFKFNMNKDSALFEKKENDIIDVGYIQRNKFGKLFVVWRNNETIEEIHDKIEICITLNACNILDKNMSLYNLWKGFYRITNMQFTYKIKQEIIKRMKLWQPELMN